MVFTQSLTQSDPNLPVLFKQLNHLRVKGSLKEDPSSLLYPSMSLPSSFPALIVQPKEILHCSRAIPNLPKVLEDLSDSPKRTLHPPPCFIFWLEGVLNLFLYLCHFPLLKTGTISTPSSIYSKHNLTQWKYSIYGSVWYLDLHICSPQTAYACEVLLFYFQKTETARLFNCFFKLLLLARLGGACL